MNTKLLLLTERMSPEDVKPRSSEDRKYLELGVFALNQSEYSPDADIERQKTGAIVIRSVETNGKDTPQEVSIKIRAKYKDIGQVNGGQGLNWDSTIFPINIERNLLEDYFS